MSSHVSTQLVTSIIVTLVSLMTSLPAFSNVIGDYHKYREEMSRRPDADQAIYRATLLTWIAGLVNDRKSTHNFQGFQIGVTFRSITEETADVYLVPQNRVNAADEFVSSVIASEGREGHLAYEEHVKNNPAEYGDAFFTRAGSNSKAKHLIHLAILPSGEEDSFDSSNYSSKEAAIAAFEDAIAKATYNALSIAHEQGAKSIALPPLGTLNFYGVSLSGEASGRAFILGVMRFLSDHRTTTIKNITVAVYPNSRFANPIDEFLGYDHAIRTSLTNSPPLKVPRPKSRISRFFDKCAAVLSRW